MSKKIVYIISILSFQCLISLPNISWAQNSIAGRVVDVKNKKEIKGAAIYFPEIGIVLNTNDSGQFQSSEFPFGKVTIQISKENFETQITQIEIKNQMNEFSFFLIPSDLELEEFVLIGNAASSFTETSRSTAIVSNEELKQQSNMSLTDAIAKVPGVWQFTSGTGISRPVIRGLSGYRIQTIVNGVRFDNQQFQDEHGLGLTDIGASRIEIIKGPAALLYGSEAMGGVINIIDEKPATANSLEQDATLKLFGNTTGESFEYGIKKSKKNKRFKFRFNEVIHQDYHDGNNNQIVNSGFSTFNLRASYGVTNKNFVSENNIYSSFSNFGFLVDSVGLIKRNFGIKNNSDTTKYNDPFHQVLFTILNSKNTFFREKYKIITNFGVQSNLRQEQEGGGGISLQMLLNTFSLQSDLIYENSKNSQITTGIREQFQTMTNFGSRTIIPDAFSNEISLYVYAKKMYHKIILDGGFRFDNKKIKTFLTGLINNLHNPLSPDNSVLPISRSLPSLNGSFGVNWKIVNHFIMKFSGASGVRSPNLAELSSNGLHEGTFRWELGNTKIKNEHSMQGEVSIIFETKEFSFQAAAYINVIKNYIYLSPTKDTFLGFAIYRSLQHDAQLSGGEAGFDYKPKFAKRFDFSSTFSYIKGTLANSENLPLIAPSRIDAKIKYNEKKHKAFLQFSYKYVWTQNNISAEETTTPGYQLMDIIAGIPVRLKKYLFNVSASCTNLTNTVYFDHLSRYKYFSIYNMGRNFSITASIKF